MTLPAHQFIRRFLNHVLPAGFHRIRHYGLFANGNRAANIVRARELLRVPAAPRHISGRSTATSADQEISSSSAFTSTGASPPPAVMNVLKGETTGCRPGCPGPVSA